MSSLTDLNCDVHLHAEIELLKQALSEKNTQLIAMETDCLRESDRQVELEDSIIAWQDKYDRLYESHKRVQKVNQNLEDKLLKLVDRNSGERAQLTSDVATLSVRLAQANYLIANLQREIERYKADMGLAIQLLQCKPDSFVPQKITSLPIEIQTKVTAYMRLDTQSHSDSEGSTHGGVATSGSYTVLPASDSPPLMCPFPPTAMVYSMRGIDNKDGIQHQQHQQEQNQLDVSPSIMAKFLEDELKSSDTLKHCDTCLCTNNELMLLTNQQKTFSVGTQTILNGNSNNSLCLRCNNNLNSPSRTNSPYIMKLIKSSDSVISETKSSVSNSTQNDKLLFTPGKKDDLMVNPILGHHRLCDRTTKLIDTTISTNANTTTTNTTNNILINDNIIIDTEIIDKQQQQYQQNQINIQQHQHKNINNNNKIQLLRSNENSPKLIDCNNKQQQIINNNDDGNNIEIVNSSNNDNNIINLDNNHDNDNKLQNGKESFNLISVVNDNNIMITKENSLSGQGNGSTNSLWSKTSSNTNTNTEGAKMFESFNLNLIKTIKAENPKMSGPRLCALRIPNGSNNILLDNVEPTLSPIVYTKRTRFVDEELDDTRDIITTPNRILDTQISMVMSSGINGNKTDSEKCREAHSKDNLTCLTTQIINPVIDSTHVVTTTTTATASSNAATTNNCIQTVNNELLLKQNSLINHQDSNIIKVNENNIECDNDIIINSCKIPTKSLTQSSSISSDVDLQESVLLRRQQLTRVAEWVQNSSQIIDIEKISINSSTDAISIDSGYKTKINNNLIASDDNIIININNNNIIAQLKTNSNNINNNNNKMYKTSLSDDKKLVNSNDFAQTNGTVNIINNINNNIHNINNLHYLKNNTEVININCDNINNDINKTISAPILSLSSQQHQQTSSQHVDLAQMEYNVKQFLLKQNEWSIHNKPTTSPINTANNVPHRTETNL